MHNYVTYTFNWSQADTPNSFKPEVNYHLDKFYQMINKKASSGLEILGGLKLKYFLATSLGENNSNGLKKEVLDSTKI